MSIVSGSTNASQPIIIQDSSPSAIILNDKIKAGASNLSIDYSQPLPDDDAQEALEAERQYMND